MIVSTNITELQYSLQRATVGVPVTFEAITLRVSTIFCAAFTFSCSLAPDCLRREIRRDHIGPNVAFSQRGRATRGRRTLPEFVAQLFCAHPSATARHEV